MTAIGADEWIARQSSRVPIIGQAGASRLKAWSEIEAMPEPEWIVEGLMPQAGIGQIFGPSNEGKTFVAIDLAMRVANGMADWHGHQIVRHGPVVYCLMEGLYDWRRRGEAWMAANHGNADNLFTLPEEDLNISDPESVQALITDVVNLKLDVGPVMVIVDTQALATPGVNENDNSEMGRVLSLLKQASQKTQSMWITIHHTGHEGTRARGASSQRAALDLEISVMDKEIRFTKVKYAETPRPCSFELVPSGSSVWAAPSIGSADSGMSRRHQTVLDVVRAEPEITRSQLYDFVKGDKRSCNQVIDELVADGWLHEVTSGRSRRYTLRERTETADREVNF